MDDDPRETARIGTANALVSLDAGAPHKTPRRGAPRSQGAFLAQLLAASLREGYQRSRAGPGCILSREGYLRAVPPARALHAVAATSARCDRRL